MLKLLKNEPKVDVLPNADFQLKDVGICLWEPDPSFYTYVPTPPEDCPVCGSNKFEDGKRLSALLNPRFEGGFRYVKVLWIPPECFDDCIETSEREPRPW